MPPVWDNQSGQDVIPNRRLIASATQVFDVIRLQTVHAVEVRQHYISGARFAFMQLAQKRVKKWPILNVFRLKIYSLVCYNIKSSSPTVLTGCLTQLATKTVVELIDEIVCFETKKNVRSKVPLIRSVPSQIQSGPLPLFVLPGWAGFHPRGNAIVSLSLHDEHFNGHLSTFGNARGCPAMNRTRP